MKNFKTWGTKSRKFPDYNYNAIFFNLKTIRLGTGVAKELPPDKAEFYDVGINNKCNAECPFCYVAATAKGVNYPNISETWSKWMDTMDDNSRPFQIAIGSTGEPTIHPEFTRFLETVYNTGVVPNYTTNGKMLAGPFNGRTKEILEATAHFVGGVAVSFGNELLKKEAREAVENLISFGDTNINLHHIISNRSSVDKFIAEAVGYGDNILYHVLLPLMESGRSNNALQVGVFEYLEEQILKHDIKNVAFGAHFVKALETSKIKTWLYPPESLSKNIILTENKVQITPSSFNLNPIQVINL